MALAQELGYPNPIKDPAHEAVLSIVHTGALLSKEGYAVLAPLGLTDSQFNVLMLLRYQSESGALSQIRLGQMLLVNRSNVTGMIDRMEQAGWVERREDSRDRRVKMVRLSRKGQKLQEQAEKLYMERLQEVMGGVSQNKLRQLNNVLAEIREELLIEVEE